MRAQESWVITLESLGVGHLIRQLINMSQVSASSQSKRFTGTHGSRSFFTDLYFLRKVTSVFFNSLS